MTRFIMILIGMGFLLAGCSQVKSTSNNEKNTLVVLDESSTNRVINTEITTSNNSSVIGNAVVPPTVLSYEAVTIINQYIEYILLNKWDEYIDLFDYDSEDRANLLSFLKDSKNQASKEGMHGIQNIKLVSMVLTNNPEFILKGDYVYDVLLDMKVHEVSEFYMNGITHHIFIFNKTNEGLIIETVYFKGLAEDK